MKVTFKTRQLSVLVGEFNQPRETFHQLKVKERGLSFMKRYAITN